VACLQDSRTVAVVGDFKPCLPYVSLNTADSIANHTLHGQPSVNNQELFPIAYAYLPLSTYLPSACLYLPPQSPSEQAPSAEAGLRAWLMDKHIHRHLGRIASLATIRRLYWLFGLDKLSF